MSFELRTYLIGAVGVLACVSLVSPSSVLGWVLLAALVTSNIAWVVRRLQEHQDAVKHGDEA